MTVAAPRRAGAQGSEPAPRARDPIEVDLPADIAITATSLALGGSLHLLGDELVRSRCAPHCDSATVNGLDRSVVGTYSASAATAGDILVGLNMALPVAFGAIETALGERSQGLEGFGEEVLLLGQTVALNIGLHQIATFASQRPRPYAYAEHAPLELRRGANAYLSFYSGHAANSFGMATAFSTMFGLRHPNSPLVVPVWTATHGLAALEGYLRVVSGYHYWTDVLVGAGIGSGIGLLVPWLHRPGESASASELSFTVLPSSVGGGPGLVVLAR